MSPASHSLTSAPSGGSEYACVMCKLWQAHHAHHGAWRRAFRWHYRIHLNNNNKNHNRNKNDDNSDDKDNVNNNSDNDKSELPL